MPDQAKRMDPWAEMRKRQEAPAEEEPTPKEPTTGFSDPYEQLVSKVAKDYIPEGTPDWVRGAGRMLIPQNTPELATTAALSLLGGPAAGAVGKGVIPAVKAAASLAGKTGLVTGAAAALTGHDPWTQGALGAVGGFGGQLTSHAVRNVMQSHTVGRMLEAVSGQVSDAAHWIIGSEALPKETGPLLRSLVSGEAVSAVASDASRYMKKFYNREIGLDALTGKLSKAMGVPVEIPEGLPWADKSVMTAMREQFGKDVIVPGKNPGTVKWGPLWEKGGTPEFQNVLLSWLSREELAPYEKLLGASERAATLSRFLTGGNPQRALATVFGPKDQITKEGWQMLQNRFIAQEPALRETLGEAGVNELRLSLFGPTATGLERFSPGSTVRVDPYISARGPHAGFHVRGGRVPSAPGWEEQAGPSATLAPAAIRAILGQQPQKLAE